MKEICDNSLDEKSSLEERRNKFESIKMKYAELKKSEVRDKCKFMDCDAKVP
jgi:hypothetical protein